MILLHGPEEQLISGGSSPRLASNAGGNQEQRMAATREARLGYVPHFDVVTIDGHRVRYQEIWQRRNLVLAVLPADHHTTAVRFADDLMRRRRDFDEAETTLVVTTGSVPGVPAPCLVIADRWGEIQHVAAPAGGDLSQLPDPDEVLSWIRFVRIQCPECPP
jgi:hypothetical protein